MGFALVYGRRKVPDFQLTLNYPVLLFVSCGTARTFFQDKEDFEGLNCCQATAIVGQRAVAFASNRNVPL